MSASAETTGCLRSPSASKSRRTGVSGTVVRAISPSSDAAAATATAAPGETAPTTAPATAGPIAWPTVGRTMPSKPLTAIRSDSGTSAGSHAE